MANTPKKMMDPRKRRCRDQGWRFRCGTTTRRRCQSHPILCLRRDPSVDKLVAGTGARSKGPQRPPDPSRGTKFAGRTTAQHAPSAANAIRNRSGRSAAASGPQSKKSLCQGQRLCGWRVACGGFLLGWLLYAAKSRRRSRWPGPRQLWPSRHPLPRTGSFST